MEEVITDARSLQGRVDSEVHVGALKESEESFELSLKHRCIPHVSLVWPQVVNSGICVDNICRERQNGPSLVDEER